MQPKLDATAAMQILLGKIPDSVAIRATDLARIEAERDEAKRRAGILARMLEAMEAERDTLVRAMRWVEARADRDRLIEACQGALEGREGWGYEIERALAAVGADEPENLAPDAVQVGIVPRGTEPDAAPNGVPK